MKTQTNALSLIPARPNLKLHIANDESLQTAILRCLASITASDGTVNLEEYKILCDFIGQCEQPALAAHMVHTYLENPIDPKTSFSKLAAAAPKDLDIRRFAFDVATPLLKIQGNQSRKLAQEMATALKIQISSDDLDEIENGATPTSIGNFMKRSKRLVLDRSVLAATDHCIRLSGDPDVAKMAAEYLDGKVGKDSLCTRMTEINEEVLRQLEAFEERIHEKTAMEEVAQKYLETADQLFKQVSQRLALVASRIQNEKEAFADNFEEFIHDAGNAFELEVADRLKTDKWKSADVWDSIAKSSFAKELERRISRIVHRHENQLKLMKEDLRIFQEDMQMVNVSILKRQHHTEFAQLMPSLRTWTRTVNTAEDIADATIKGGAVLTGAAGAAVYFLGTAVVLPVVMPVAPYVVGAMFIAGLLKWFTDGQSRKGKEILHKRQEFEKLLRERLTEAQSSYFSQLDMVSEEFVKSANALIKPVILEAEAAHQLVGLQQKISKKMLKNARKSIDTMSSQLSLIPGDGP